MMFPRTNVWILFRAAPGGAVIFFAVRAGDVLQWVVLECIPPHLSCLWAFRLVLTHFGEKEY